MNANAEIGPEEGRVNQARRRGHIYGFLAAIFRTEPGIELAEWLKVPEVHRALLEAGMALGWEDVLDVTAERLAKDLADDYRALFISPRDRIALNESVNREEDGCFMGESTVRVSGFMSSLGLRVLDSWTDFPDHLSVEFELMQRLADTEAALLEGDDSAMASECTSRERAFLNDHIEKWVPRLCNAIQARAKTTFYRQLARLTREFIREERHRLG